MEGNSIDRVLGQIKMNIQESNQRNQGSLQKRSEREQRQVYYKCEKCHDTGWILKRQEHSQPLAIRCYCKNEEKIKNSWKAVGINPEMINYKFANFKIWNDASRLIKDTATAYFSDFDEIRNSRRNSILLCGQVGSGKSHLTIALGLNFLKRNVRVMYMPYRDVITKIKQNMIDEEYYQNTISRYQVCEVLLIDDLFKGKINESDVNIMFEIINYRYLNFLPIIVSSEFKVDKLLYFDQGVGSRIYEMCKDYIIEIENDISNNYRLR
ncbi:AAA family ATPase [Clostridium botulinum]|nr:AAA family ATPase [Clostridium botulinum]NFL42579.1 AAA family ATPase [Clostridium botulinum]NFN20897.1 AAA family ATPase [Clostridium botulinum]NFN41475.1 AAA family ATPase [Clostridium botulinum]NFR81266.1 AAA family ATPase [Clostridium botulinum]